MSMSVIGGNKQNHKTQEHGNQHLKNEASMYFGQEAGLLNQLLQTEVIPYMALLIMQTANGTGTRMQWKPGGTGV